MTDIKLHLSNLNLTLVFEDIKAPFSKKIPCVRRIKVFGTFFSPKGLYLYDIEIDERYYNTFRFIKTKEDIDPILKSKFNEFKKSNFNYGTFLTDNLIGTGVLSALESTGCGYLGSKALYVEDFFEYLKADNRDKIINTILE